MYFTRTVFENQTTTSSGGEEVSTANIAGRWDEVDEGETSTFILAQDGNRIGVQVMLSGQMISTGSGEVNNRNVFLNFTLLGLATTLRATVSADGNTMNGTYTIQANGTTQPVKLVRRTN